MTLRVVIGGIWLLAMVAGWGLWSGAGAAPLMLESGHVAVSTSVSGSVIGAPTWELERTEEPRIDLFGNEIENAVADYRYDVRGEIYERHSPDTAVPSLGPPGT